LEEKQSNKSIRQQSFYTIAEVTITELAADKILILEKKSKLFQNGFNNMINFEFKWDAQKTMNLFSLNIQTS
jgi:alpha-amylase